MIVSCASSPTVAKGYVYFGSNNNSLFCFDANPLNDGIDEGIDDPDDAQYDLIWVFDTGGDIQHTPAVYHEKVYVVSRRCAGGDLYCLDATTGKEIWHKYGGDVTTSPVIYNGRIYYGAIGGSTDTAPYASRIVCIDGDNPGTRYWEYGIETFVVYATPAIAYGTVFAGDDNGHMYCLDADDGTLLWERQTDCKWMGSAPAVADNKVYTLSGQQVVCLDCATGDVLWTQKINRVDVPYKYVSPCIADDTVFVGVVEKSSAKSCIYAFADGIGIQKIRSGRPGPKVIVQNTGDIDVNVNVLIKFEHVAGFIFAWPEIPLSIGPLKAGTTYTHKRRVCGLGNIRIIASVNSAQTGYGSSKTVQAFVLGRNTIVLPDIN
jgi:outer membrane protein assembly factor BamB